MDDLKLYIPTKAKETPEKLMTNAEAVKVLCKMQCRYNYMRMPDEAFNAFLMAIEALRALPGQITGALQTTWETPEACPYCMERLSKEWSFCPQCGRITAWSENKPITVSEFTRMVAEPVWIFDIGDPASGRWQLVDRCLPLGPHACLELYGVWEGHYRRDLGDYGKTWLAYRRKPEREE